MNFETPYYNGDRIGNVMKGFFVAPKTASYRFYMSCDDYCRLNMALDSSQPDNMTQLLSMNGKRDYRSYYSPRGGEP